MPATRSTATWVLRRLRSAGHQALFAGGCVRDMLLGARSSDYDVATDATPDQVKSLFRRVLLVGAKFGVAMVIHKGRKVEVTTFRNEESYSDGRRPDRVRFTTDREDAQRRDFTINGMFYDPLARQVIDYVGGQQDLARRLIRTIGPPQERFAEDYLRMLRAVRFAMRLGFSLDPETEAAIRRYAPHITSISGERIFDELSKMLSRASAAGALGKLEELGLAEEILPELLERPPLWRRALARVGATAKRADLSLTLGAILCELPGADVSRIIRRWGASNELRDAIRWMSEHLGDWKVAGIPAQSQAAHQVHKAPAPGAPEESRAEPGLSLAGFKCLMANENFERLTVLLRVEEQMQTGGGSMSRRIARRAASVRPEQIAPRPFITGADLKKIGLSEGPRLGRILRASYEAQLDEHVHSRKEAFDLVLRMLRGHEDQKEHLGRGSASIRNRNSQIQN